MGNKLYVFIFVVLAILTGSGSVFFFLENKPPLGVLLLLLTIFFVCHVLRFIFKIFQDIDDFAEAVKYRDFSKKYPESQKGKKRFYRNFNTIIHIFLALNREKETQQQYLKKMLEVVDTGILAYDLNSYDTLWMNDALKNMLQIPYLKNINQLKKRNEKLFYELHEITLGESRLINISAGKQVIKVLATASIFQTGENRYKLIAFHNISATLEEVEAGAWKSLLNVMTHEIMNSIAPVSSLADTLKKRLGNIKKEIGVNFHADFEDIEFAMETIQRRSEGLLRFADSYRNLSKNITPDIRPTNLYELLFAVYSLMHPSLQQKKILLEIKTDYPTVMADVDHNLIEQVIINFITNATYAVKDKAEPHIILFSGKTPDGIAYITVADNGCGITSENIDKIYIPFFSTKKNGTGIGLSLSREIVKLHKGSLQIQTQEGEGSAFTILFSGSFHSPATF